MIVEPWRVWIKDGNLRALAIVEGKVEIIPMYVILFNDLFVYAKNPKEYLGKVYLHEAWIKDEQDAGGTISSLMHFDLQLMGPLSLQRCRISCSSIHLPSHSYLRRTVTRRNMNG